MKTIKLDGVEISEDKLRQIIKENPELVEEKGGRWKPRNGEEYYQIGNDGGVGIAQWYCGDLEADSAYDNWNWKINNVFKTEEEAEQRKAEIEALAKINDYIDSEGLRVSEAEIEEETFRYYIYYRPVIESSYHGSVYDNHSIGLVDNLKSKEAAQQIIDKFEDELKVVFKIK